MEIKIVNLEDITEQELLAVMDENRRAAEMMESKIKEFQAIQTKSDNLPNKKQEIISKGSKQKSFLKEQSREIDTEFEDEVSYYLTEIRNITMDDIETELENALPSKSHYQFQRIILRLKLECLKNIKDIKELLEEEKGNISLEDIQDFKEEILLEQRKIELLNQVISEKISLQEEQDVQNNFIFALRSGGNIRVLEEIARIPSEYYPGFKGLFDSIKNGTFKNVKRFTDDLDLAGICEVRDLVTMTRVVFDRVDQYTYVLITAFVKKNTGDCGCRDSMKRKIMDYKRCADNIKENLNNDEFIKINQEYETELYRILGGKDKGIERGKRL